MTLYTTCAKAVGLTAPEKAVLRELARRADKSNRAVVGQDAIAIHVELSLRAVNRAISSLKKKGWVSVEVRHRRDGRRGFNVYTVTDPIAQHRAMEASKRLPLIKAIENPKPHGELINRDHAGHVESFDFRARRRW